MKNKLSVLFLCTIIYSCSDVKKVLIDQLFHTEHPYYCPHGRPIIVNLGIEELDRRFERIW